MKVIWLLEELGLKYERVDVGGAFGGDRYAALSLDQSAGAYPTLQEDDFTTFESNVILRYVCNAHAPLTNMYPQDPRARAAVEAWMDFQQTALSRHQSLLFQGLIRTPPEKRNMAVIEAAIKDAAKIWAILDAPASLRIPILPEATSRLPDMAFGPHVHRWFNMAFERPAAPHLFAWYERMLARPHFKAHCAGAIV